MHSKSTLISSCISWDSNPWPSDGRLCCLHYWKLINLAFKTVIFRLRSPTVEHKHLFPRVFCKIHTLFPPTVLQTSLSTAAVISTLTLFDGGHHTHLAFMLINLSGNFKPNLPLNFTAGWFKLLWMQKQSFRLNRHLLQFRDHWLKTYQLCSNPSEPSFGKIQPHKWGKCATLAAACAK